MYAVKAIYDGNHFKPTQPVSIKEPHEVVIMFIGPISQAEKHNTRFLLAPDSNKVPAIGEWNGTIHIPDDFKKPLEEMKEYMY